MFFPCLVLPACSIEGVGLRLSRGRGLGKRRYVLRGLLVLLSVPSPKALRPLDFKPESINPRFRVQGLGSRV